MIFLYRCGGMADAGDLKSLAKKHVGSNPTTGTIFVPVAQLAEQGTFNPKVVGSIPTGRTIVYRADF